MSIINSEPSAPRLQKWLAPVLDKHAAEADVEAVTPVTSLIEADSSEKETRASSWYSRSQKWFDSKFRPSSLLRILFGTSIFTIGGIYSGHILARLDNAKRYLKVEQSLKKELAFSNKLFFWRWIKLSVVMSTSFFVLNEVITAYLTQTKQPCNSWITSTASGFIVYRLTYMRMRALSRLDVGSDYRMSKIFRDFTMFQMKKRIFKYSLTFVVFNLCLEMYIYLIKRRLMVQSSKDEGDTYTNLSKREKRMLETMRKSRQFVLFSFGEQHQLGGESPFIIMREDQEEYVQECQLEVQKTFAQVLRKMKRPA